MADLTLDTLIGLVRNWQKGWQTPPHPHATSCLCSACALFAVDLDAFDARRQEHAGNLREESRHCGSAYDDPDADVLLAAAAFLSAPAE